jgi:hypothetical protein
MALPTVVRCKVSPPSLEYEEQRQERIAEQQVKGKVVEEVKYTLLGVRERERERDSSFC